MFRSSRALQRALALGGGSTSPAMGVAAVTGSPAAASTAVTGGGASLPYTGVQAETRPTNGSVIGPRYTAGEPADEAPAAASERPPARPAPAS